MIISLTGFMGCGKSTVGKALAERLGWEFIDLDSRIEHKKGMTAAEIISSEGEEAFRAVEAECLRDVVVMHQLTGENLVLALGGGTVTIKSVQHLIFGETTCVFLKTSIDTIKSRIGEAPASRPLFSDELYGERMKLYEKAALTVVTEGRTPYESAMEISFLISK